MKRITARDYANRFRLDATRRADPDEITAHALQVALETREFEIQLYWERAKYFWTFIAATLAGFAAVQTLDDSQHKTFLSVILSCLGFLFSWAWYLVNRGSKLWQENWENHVALLEDKIHGPLFKTILLRDERLKLKAIFKGALFLRPARYSVSKINLLVSLSVTVFWGFMIYSVCPRPFTYSWEAIDWNLARPILLTFVAFVLLAWWGRSDFRDKKESKHDLPKADYVLKAMQNRSVIHPDGGPVGKSEEQPMITNAHDAIVQAWNLTVKARATCPHADASAVGLRGYDSPAWYREHGAAYFVNLAEALTLEDVRELNEIGQFINRSFVISMAAILEAYGVVSDSAKVDRDRKGGDHIQLVRWLRNRFAHGQWTYDPKDKYHVEMRELMEKLFSKAIDGEGAFIVSIDEILEPLKNGVLEYVRATAP